MSRRFNIRNIIGLLAVAVGTGVVGAVLRISDNPYYLIVCLISGATYALTFPLIRYDY